MAEIPEESSGYTSLKRYRCTYACVMVAPRKPEALPIEWTLTQHNYISVAKDPLEYSTPA